MRSEVCIQTLTGSVLFFNVHHDLFSAAGITGFIDVLIFVVSSACECVQSLIADSFFSFVPVLLLSIKRLDRKLDLQLAAGPVLSVRTGSWQRRTFTRQLWPPSMLLIMVTFRFEGQGFFAKVVIHLQGAALERLLPLLEEMEEVKEVEEVEVVGSAWL